MTPADALTLFRALAGIPILYALAYGHHPVALALFAAAALSDALDGFVARRGRTAEGRGVIADPLADKALVILTVTALALAQRVPLGLSAIVVAREIAVAFVRVVEHRRGLVVHATAATKLKTACEMLALAVLIAAQPSDAMTQVGTALLTVAAIIGILTLPTYLRHAAHRLT